MGQIVNVLEGGGLKMHVFVSEPMIFRVASTSSRLYMKSSLVCFFSSAMTCVKDTPLTFSVTF